jgi:hypothetical protein
MLSVNESLTVVSLLILVAALIPTFLAFIERPPVMASEPTVKIVTSTAGSQGPVAARSDFTIIINLVRGAAASVLPIIAYGFRLAWNLLTRPLLALLSVVATILWPVYYALETLALILFFPIKVTASIGKFLYPLYVFVGAACVVGLSVALFVRGVAALTIFLVRDDSPAPQEEKRKENLVASPHRGRSRQSKEVQSRDAGVALRKRKSRTLIKEDE